MYRNISDILMVIWARKGCCVSVKRALFDNANALTTIIKPTIICLSRLVFIDYLISTTIYCFDDHADKFRRCPYPVLSLPNIQWRNRAMKIFNHRSHILMLM